MAATRLPGSLGLLLYTLDLIVSEVRARHHGHGVAKNRNKRTPANRARLYDSLLQNYNVILRPVKEERDVINVTHSLGLMQILEFDVVKQLLTFTAMEHLRWDDSNLQWSPNEFGDVKEILIMPKDLWSPGVVLTQAAEPAVIIHDVPLKVTNMGNITYKVTKKYVATCRPLFKRTEGYSEYNCSLQFRPWSYDGNKVEIRPQFYNIDTTEYTPSTLWDLRYSDAKQNRRFYPCCVEPYPDVTYTLSLRMRSHDDVPVFAQDKPPRGSSIQHVPSIWIVALLSSMIFFM